MEEVPLVPLPPGTSMHSPVAVLDRGPRDCRRQHVAVEAYEQRQDERVTARVPRRRVGGGCIVMSFDSVQVLVHV